jgi:hypothetical protein
MGAMMTERMQLSAALRDHLLATAQEELSKFERTERDFRKKDREERAVELQLPIDPLDLR